jgi:hypothetical protein
MAFESKRDNLFPRANPIAPTVVSPGLLKDDKMLTYS